MADNRCDGCEEAKEICDGMCADCWAGSCADAIVEAGQLRDRVAELEAQVACVEQERDDRPSAAAFEAWKASAAERIAEVVRERDEARAEAGWNAAGMRFHRGETTRRLEQAEAAAALLRTALEDWVGAHANCDEECICNGEVSRLTEDALATDAGRGWVSPEVTRRVVEGLRQLWPADKNTQSALGLLIAALEGRNGD